PSGPPRGMRGLGRFQTAQPRLHSRKPSACMTTEKENCVPPFPEDVFTEPEPDPHTLRNLGPLAPLAGIWEGQRGLDVHPAEEGRKKTRTSSASSCSRSTRRLTACSSITACATTLTSSSQTTSRRSTTT